MPIGPSGTRQRLEPLDQLVAQRLVVGGLDHALGLAARDVEAQPAVVAALAPRPGARPVHVGVAQRGAGRRRRAQVQVALLHEPVVDADRALHRPRAVVGDDHHDGVVVEALEQLADLVVEVLVVALDDAAVAMAGLVRGVRGVEVAPERVVEPVEPDLDHHEEVPLARVEQVPRDREVLLGHRVDLGEDAVAVVAAEVADVHLVGAGEPLDLVAELGRVGVRVAPRVRREEVRHEDAVERGDGVGLGDAQHDRAAPRPAEAVPEALRGDRPRVGGAHRRVVVRGAVAEAVDAEVARLQPGHHAAPGGDRDRRVDAAQPPRRARAHQAREVGQLVEPGVERERRLGAVEPDDGDPRAHRFFARVRARRVCVSPSWRILAVRTTRTVRVRAARRSARGSRTRTVRVPGARLRRV